MTPNTFCQIITFVENRRHYALKVLLPHLSLSRLLRVATDDLDFLRLYIGLIVQLEVGVLDQEGPDFVAEAVGIEMTLSVRSQQTCHGQPRYTWI